jgi:hypothetical protein
MKFMIIALTGAALTLLSVAAEAQYVRDGLWCLNSKENRGGGSFRCDFATYRQCMASRAANGEWCMRNPRFGGRGY